MMYSIAAYGHILDNAVMDKTWRRFKRDLVQNEYDIRNVVIELQSSLACQRREGLSRLSCSILASDDEKVKEVTDFLESQDVKIAYCHESNLLQVHPVSMPGHFIEDKLMDRIAEAFKRFKLDVEDVVIRYSSLALQQNRAMPSTVEFKIVSTEPVIREALKSIEVLSAAQKSERTYRVSDIPTESLEKYFVRIWGHILDTNLLEDIGKIVDPGLSDIRDVSVRYLSSNVCHDYKEHSLLSFVLASNNAGELLRGIRTICAEPRHRGARLLTSIPLNKRRRSRYIIKGDILERAVLDAMSNLIFSDRRAERIDIEDIRIQYDSVANFADFKRQSELFCTFEYDCDVCGDAVDGALRNIEAHYDCETTQIPSEHWRNNE